MAIEISLKVQKNIKCKGRQVGDYIYDDLTDTIYFDLPYFFPCKFAVKSLSEITATPAMVKMWTFLKYHNLDWLRQQLSQIKYIQNDSVLLHGAAWEKYGKGHLAVGFANSGKTTIVLRKLADGAKYCSDENVVIKNGIMYPISRKTSLNPWIAKEINYPLTLKQKIEFSIAKIKSKICPIFEPNIWVDLPYERHAIKLDYLHYLTEGKGQSLLTLTNNEFPFYTNPVIQSYAYASGFDLEGIYAKYKRIIRRIEGGKC